MTNKTKTMVGIVAALGVAATLGTYAWLSENDTKPVAKQDAVSKPVPPPTRFSYPSLPSAASAEGRAPGCTFAKGDALSYDVSLSASVTVDPTRVAQAASAPAPTFQTDTRATLDLEVLEATGDSADGNGTAATLLARFRSVDTPLLTNASYLTAPFLVKVNAECAIDGFARASATKKSHGRIQQGLVHELLFHWAADPAVAARDDENSMGPFTARYAVLGDKDGTLVQRRIASYGKFWEDDFGNGRKLDVVPTDSLMSVRVGAGPWFEGLSAVDAVANGIDSVREELNVRRVKATAGALAASSHTASDYIWENLLPLNLPLDNPQPLTGRDIALQSRVANLTTEESLARLEDRIQKETGIADLWPELSAYLEAKPHAAFEVEAKLRAGEVSPEAESMVFVALGHARTEEARRVLHGIMLDSAAPAMERTRAMFSLIDREDVGVELANELHGISAAMYSGRDRNERFVGREAALAVSAMAGLKEDHEDVAAVAKNMALSIIHRGGSARSLRPGYSAIANIGDPSLLSEVVPATRSKDWKLRQVAAIVVRRMHPTATANFLGDWLARETDPRVKREIYDTVERQTQDIHESVGSGVIAAAVRDLATQPGPITRKAILHILGREAATSPVAKRALIDQLAIEVQNPKGLLVVISKYLGPDELRQGINQAEALGQTVAMKGGEF